MNLLAAKRLFPAVFFACAAGLGWAQNAGSPAPPSLSLTQIVDQLQLHDRARTNELKHYQALRHYEVEYRGFSAKIAAAMDVEVTYDSATGKSLRIVKQSGSGTLCDKVLKRALESEKEAFQNKASTSMTGANYRFNLVGAESVAGRPAYILDLVPLTESKFLIRGKIWVDAAEFAVVKMETEPAKSPSFWISRTLIHYTSAKTDGFWFPEQVRSETKVRIGGTAVMNIDYGKYKVVPEVASLGVGP
jgi:hypothetical protein